ncbi:MAG: Tfp pilus assembly protein FimT/FimU [Syntrophales bacterium]
MEAMTRSRGRLSKKGFTLIEVIAVLIILGMILAFVIVKMNTTSDADLASQIHVIKNHLRYAQSRAMSTGTVWGVNINTRTTYYLYDGADPSTPVLFLGEKDPTVDLAVAGKKSKLEITSEVPKDVRFNAYGSPINSLGNSVAETITVSTNGGDILITKNTGFIP